MKSEYRDPKAKTPVARFIYSWGGTIVGLLGAGMLLEMLTK